MKSVGGIPMSHPVFRSVPQMLLELAMLFCVAAIPSAAQSTAGQSENSTVSLHDRVWIASQAYSDIQTYFGHWRAVPDLDFDKKLFQNPP
jgi:hypothetical protein